MGNYIKVKRGISYKSGDIQECGTPFINLNSFNLNGDYKFDGIKYFNGKYKIDNIISNGDLVVAVTDVTRNADIIGKSFLIPNIFDGDILISCDVAKIEASLFKKSYLKYLFNSHTYHEYIKHYASGTLVLHLDVKGIEWFNLAIPPEFLLNKFDEIYLSVFERINQTLKQNQQLTQLRDFLLPMLMNGQVGVRDE